MASEKEQIGLGRAREALGRVTAALNDEPARYGMGEIIGRIKNGSLCIIRTDRLLALMDRLDGLEEQLIEEKTMTGKRIDEAAGKLFNTGGGEHP